MWVVVFVLYQLRKNHLDAGSIILLSYIAYAVCSLGLYNTYVEFYTFNPLTLFPFVYLFVMLLIALAPVLKYESDENSLIVPPNMFVLNTVSWLIVLSTILSIPAFYSMIQRGNFLLLLVDESAGAEMYSEAMAESGDSGGGISNIPAILFNAFSDVAIFLFFYYLTLRKRNWLLIAGLFMSVLASMISPMLSGLRTNTVIAFFTVIIAYFLFRNQYGKQLRKWLERTWIVVFISASVPLLAITMSRFSNSSGAGTSVLYYVGQANLNFNNYGLDNGGIRNGDRTFNLAKRLIDSSTPINYSERRAKYPNLHMDDYIFYTFVGDFTLDFGPWIAPFIIFFFTIFILNRTQSENKIYKFHQILLVYLVACICMQGGMYLFAYSDTAGLKLIVVILLYYLFKFLHLIHQPAKVVA